MALVDEQGRQRVADAISKAESRTSGEIVAVVAADSSTYMHIPFMWAALVALLVPWPFIHFTWMTVQNIWLLQLAVFAIMLAILMYRPLRFALVPASTKRVRAHRRAVEQFLTQNLHTTEGRTGVLLFVSVAERYVEVLADAGIHKKVPQEDWQVIVDSLTTAIGRGHAADGFIAAVDAIGTRLAQHFPPGSATNARLPNHLIVLD
jgi:putative membrane protein